MTVRGFYVLHLLLVLLFATPGAWAQTDGHTRLAEYERLGQEMQSLAARNAWPGVERAYDEMMATGIPMTAEEQHYGAQAAAALGDVAATRKRLVLALETFDSTEYRAWITTIDTNFAPVSLKADPRSVDLTVETMPFDPQQAAAIHFAQAMVEETGSFEGMLPAGVYQFGPMSLKVRPGVHTERIDIRTDKYMRKLERMQRKEHDDDEG